MEKSLPGQETLQEDIEHLVVGLFDNGSAPSPGYLYAGPGQLSGSEPLTHRSPPQPGPRGLILSAAEVGPGIP